MNRRDLYILLKIDILRFWDLPPLTAIKRKYEVENDSTIRKVIGSLKSQKVLPKDFELVYKYE